MNITYYGLNKREGIGNRNAVICNIKEGEYDILRDELQKNNYEFHGFSDGTFQGQEQLTMYIGVDDKDEYNDFKDFTYKEIKKKIKGGF